MMNQSSCPRNERELEHDVPLQPSEVLREQADIVELFFHTVWYISSDVIGVTADKE